MRLPGKDINSPEVFAFGTPYRYILDSLKSKDEEFFRKNKLLGLVARNAEIKTAPQRFQEIEGSEVAEFDVVLCFDSRVFYLVVEGTLFTAYNDTMTILTNLPLSPFSRTCFIDGTPVFDGYFGGYSTSTWMSPRASHCRKRKFCQSVLTWGEKHKNHGFMEMEPLWTCFVSLSTSFGSASFDGCTFCACFRLPHQFLHKRWAIFYKQYVKSSDTRTVFGF